MPTILIENEPLLTICAAACEGYEVPYKEERFGFLFGMIKPRGVMLITQADIYRGGTRTRTGAEYNHEKLIARGSALAQEHGLLWIGSFHSHVESAGVPYHGISKADKDVFHEMIDELPDFSVEMIVSITASDAPLRSLSPNSRSILVTDGNSYRYLVKGYMSLPVGIRQVKVRRVPAY